MSIVLLFVGSLTQTEARSSPAALSSDKQIAVFAGGCFWCMEPPFEKLSGVVSVTSGFTGGKKNAPTYKEVSSGETKHIESVKITYDPQKISYKNLLQVFWRNINPTDAGGQFVDRGHQYTTAIFYLNERQKNWAQQSKKKLAASGRFKKPIVTPIRPSGSFYQAEEYHQDYYKTHPLRYKFYRYRSGRDQFIDKMWGKDRQYKPESKNPKRAKFDMSENFKKPSDKELKEKLSEMQYEVTQEDATEPAFNNKFWNQTESGIYVDIVSGEALFSSKDKFKSGTGWPSFTRPLEEQNIVEKTDRTLFIKRTEVRSKHGDSHLGHVFDDGPKPTGLRYCINSAAMRFIPADKLEEEGYEQYTHLFENK